VSLLRRRATLLTSGFLLLATGATFETLLSARELPLYRDLLFFVLPFKYFLAEHLRRGEVPLWNPWIFMGTPFLAGLQSGVFYPPSLLLLAPFPLGLNLFLFVHFLIALGGILLLLRGRGLSLAATAVGSLTFVLGGYLVSMINVTNHLQAAAWVPWVLYAWFRFAEAPSLRRFAALAAALALECLGGAPETLILTVVLAAAWAVWTRLPRVTEVVRLGFGLAAALALMGAVTAFQLLPTVEYIGQSARSQALPYEEVALWSLQPVSVLQLLLPHSSSLVTEAERDTIGVAFERFAPWIASIYLGLVPLCLAIVGLAFGRERLFWGATLGAALVLALGHHLPVLGWLYQALPGLFGKFRYPEKFYLVVHLGASVLAAEGAERIFAGEHRAERLARVAAMTFAALALSVFAVEWLRPLDLLQGIAWLRGDFAAPIAFEDLATDVVFKASRLLWILGPFVTLDLLARRSLVRPGLHQALVVLLVAGDLGAVHHNLNLTVDWAELRGQAPIVDPGELHRSRERIYHYQTVSTVVPNIEAQPILGFEQWSKVSNSADNLPDLYLRVWRTFFMNAGMTYDVGTISGSDGIARSSDDLLGNVLSIVPRDKALKLLRLYSCGVLVGPVALDLEGIDRIEPETPSEFLAYRLRDPLPPAYLASRLRAADSEIKAFNVFIKPDFEPGRDAVVPKLPAGWTDSVDGATPGTVAIRSYENERVVLEVEAERPALVVLNDSYFPGWDAELDGAPVPIVRTNLFVRGVAVGPGRHVVEYRYRPTALRIGAWISAFGLLALGALTIAGFRQPTIVEPPRAAPASLEPPVAAAIGR
jgi:hypothetical protein